jgi:hypothetical protein
MHKRSRTVLYASVSILALTMASPQLRAADMPAAVVARPPQGVDPGQCQWWGEGGGIAPFGRDVHFGNPAINAGKAKFGPEVAAGFDCRFGPSPWHASAQVRYGRVQRSQSFNAQGVFSVPTGGALPGSPSLFLPFVANGSGSVTQREDHALADFAVGRDIGLGLGQTQLKLGLRIADLHSATSATGVFNVPPFLIGTPPLLPNPFGVVQNSRFVGGGPRVGLDGWVPLGGGWGIDYLGGVAVLFGQRSLDVTAVGTAAAAGIGNMGVSDAAAVFNLDAQLGLSYQFAQNLKMTLGYRFDGYWGALKTINANGAVGNEVRAYGGPMLRLTGTTETIFGAAPAPTFYAKAPPPLATNVWTVWAEGGAFSTGGDTVHFGGPLDAGRPRWGADGGAGFDMRFGATPWHVSADVRYGASRRSGTFTRNGTIVVPSGTPGVPPFGTFAAPVVANGTFKLREEHELADFAVGRDVGLGAGQVQVKAGLRIAEISSKLSASANFVAPTFFSPGIGVGLIGARPGAFSLEQDSRFAAGGPRVGVDGMVPLGGSGFAIDYLGGIAGLYGARSFSTTTGGTAAAFGFNNFGTSDHALVFNLDAQAGLSYWLTSALKVTAAYRFDGYWGALKTLDANGVLTNENRLYYGPTVRLTGKF